MIKSTEKMMSEENRSWIDDRIRLEQIEKYLGADGADFIPDGEIEAQLADGGAASAAGDGGRVRDIIAKSLAINTLTPEETAVLLNVRDAELWEEMEAAAGQVKRAVYDNRIVTFAPLYLSTLCVNNCQYCGLRSGNACVSKGVLTHDEVRGEVEALAGRIGHKRLIVVYGEHPESGIDYIVSTMGTIYGAKVPVRDRPGRTASIRRVNVNAAPMLVEELAALNGAGLGTYQVFQETYHKETYGRVHPPSTLKGNYHWRLYAMHRAMEAGIDDVGIGALFGLYDWKFEVMGLLRHAMELERVFGIGPHTISFPRLEPAENTPFATQSGHTVSDADFRKAITVIRLSVPYSGMILTARENAELRKSLIGLGITQTDASSNVGLGAYNRGRAGQEAERQQFILGDTRSLDEVVREFARMGYITSFCTAGYRCGRTGECIMDSLRSGAEGKFCKLNAVITFREWLDDFASPETKALGEQVVLKEIEELRTAVPKVFDTFMDYYDRTVSGERDLYF